MTTLNARAGRTHDPIAHVRHHQRLGLPGLALPGNPSQTRPNRLLTPGHLLLRGAHTDRATTLPEHRREWGVQILAGADDLIAAARSVGLVGAGGAEFPTARKLASLRDRRVTRVIVNGAEGEPTSGKDGVLLRHVPHLVLDGAVATAAALGAAEITVRVAGDQPDIVASLDGAIGERTDRAQSGRRIRIALSVGPDDYIAGESSAVISAVFGGRPAPVVLGRPPRNPRRLGRAGHTFLSNVETFARLAVASRGEGRASALVTISGAVSSPGVLELSPERTLNEAVEMLGTVAIPSLVISGGWHGAWLPWARIADVRLTRELIAAAGGRWGAGSFVILNADLDPRAVLIAVAEKLAGASAEQCGPCRIGLPELARSLRGLLEQPGPGRRADVDQILDSVRGGGLCAHPDATAAAIGSALSALSDLGFNTGAGDRRPEWHTP